MPILTSVVSLSNPSSSDTLNSATTALKHATQHSNANDEIEKIEGYLLNGGIPAARVYNSGAQTILTATETTITFDSETFDTDTMHSTSSNTSRITFTTPGRYIIVGTVSFVSNSAGWREGHLRINGTTYIAIAKHAAVNGASNYFTVAGFWAPAVATDYVELRVVQTSGGNLDTNATSSGIHLWAARIA